MSNMLQSIDERTHLAGSNKMEVLLFSLGLDTGTGREEIFGINVFKVREVMHIPEITQAPDMPDDVVGLVSLRGEMVPIINLMTFCKVQTDKKPKILMVTEYNKHVQGFLVHAVDTIERLNWGDVKAPPPILAKRMGSLVTAVSELENERLVMIMDVEKVLAETADFHEDESKYSGISAHENGKDITILFADDSFVAREQISRTLEHMGIKKIALNNGADAWSKLNEIAEQAEVAGRPITDYIQLILTDVEMPEMDGYVLTSKIKEDPRFNGIPVVMHSSLTAEANQALGKGVGVDAYIPKFEPQELATKLGEMIIS